MLALGSQAPALRLGQILAHFSAGQSRFEAGIRRDEFGLLGKGGAGSSKYGGGRSDMRG
jgi:hypothetical protein